MKSEKKFININAHVSDVNCEIQASSGAANAIISFTNIRNGEQLQR